MKISVIVCTRDRHETVGQAVESILQCDYPDFDVHVMDQSTNDRTREIVEDLAARNGRGRLNYHYLDKAGLSRAYNSGMQVSNGELIALTDDDCIVPTNWLGRIAAAFRAFPDAGVLFGQVMVPESLREEAARDIIVPSLAFDEMRCMARGKGFEVFGMGANMAVRRSMLERVGGFDEALGGGGPLRSSQDSDFAYRAFRFGYAVILAPDVVVDHYGTRTHEQWPTTMMNYGIGDGAFFSKHIRCGDLYALRLLMARMARSWARELKQSVRHRRWTRDLYGRNLLRGVRDAARFGIDRERRLYQENDRAQMVVTQANVVTATRRK